MELDLTEQRRRAHALLDYLSAAKLAAISSVMETMVSPLERSVALAPLDDEPVTPEEEAAILARRVSIDRSECTSMEDVLAEFGITQEELERYHELPPAEPEGR